MFDRDRIRRLRPLIEQALANAPLQQIVGDDFEASLGAASFARDGSNVTFKLTLAVKGAKGDVLTPDAQCFTRSAASYGLQAEWLNKGFQFQGTMYIVRGLRPRSHKFPVLCESCTSLGNPTGKIYKFKIGDVQAAFHVVAKRSPAAILVDLRTIEGQLSPENLTCDGELPPAEWRPKQRQLLARRTALVSELGHEPSDSELYGTVPQGLNF